MILYAFLQLASVVPQFDRITLVDVSGMGFRLVLDDISIVPPELAGGFTASDFTVPSILPVFGQDLTAVSTVSTDLSLTTAQSAEGTDQPEWVADC